MLKIKDLRTAHGLTQKDLAQNCGVSDKSIWAYENQIAIPPLDVLTKLADFFECSIDYLTGREDDFGNIILKAETPVIEQTQKAKELLEIFNALSEEYQAQILEYARYFDVKILKSKKY